MKNSDKVAAAIDNLPMPDGSVRISAAHLVSQLQNFETGDECAIAMLSVGALKQDKYRFDALGGAIALTTRGMGYAQRLFDANDIKFDSHDQTNDARFIVPSPLQARRVLKWLSVLDKSHFEIDPSREVVGELHDSEHKGYEAVLADRSRFEKLAYYDYLGVAVQPVPQDGVGTSVNAGKIPSRRLFHQWQLAVPDDLY